MNVCARLLAGLTLTVSSMTVFAADKCHDLY